MWSSLLFGLQGFASAQDADLDDDEAVVTDFQSENPEHRIPSPEEILDMLNSMELTEEEKNSLREKLLKNAPGLGAEIARDIAASNFTSQTLFLLVLLSIVSSIFEAILEKLQNSTILSKEVQDKLSNIINQYSELKDEEKIRFQENAKNVIKKTLNNLLAYPTKRNNWLTWLIDNRVIFLLAILIITFIFVFFGYKLYKSLSERERKREEKRKLKQLKKKK